MSLFLLPIFILLALLLVASSWFSQQTRRKAFRIAALFAGAVALLMLAFLQLNKEEARQGILLTEGYSPDTLEGLLRKYDEALPVFAYKVQANVANATLLAEPAQLLVSAPDIQRLHILGQGLRKNELISLGTVDIEMHLNEVEGISEAQWSNQVAVGSFFRIQGKWQGNQQDTVKVLLEVSGRAVDSALVNPEVSPYFALRYQPKLSGMFVYTLRAISQDTISYNVPTVITDPEPLRVLIVTSSPGFEVRFLKDYLASLQHQVVVWTRISKDIWQQEWLNRGALQQGRLSAALLEEVDLVLMDEEYRNSLSSAEKTTLHEAILNRGVGLLTWTNKNSGQLQRQGASNIKVLPTQSQSTEITIQSAVEQRSIQYEAPGARIEQLPGIQTWLSDQAGAALTVGQRQGRGIEAFSVATDSYTWFLRGDSTYYAAYWATILSNLSVGVRGSGSWYIPNRFALQQEDVVEICFEGADVPAKALVSSIQGTPQALSFEQDAYLPYIYTAKFAPQQAGWYKVTSDTLVQSFYVQPQGSWRALHASLRQHDTRNWVLSNDGAEVHPASEIPFRLPLWIPFVFFAVCASLLWLEEKL